MNNDAISRSAVLELIRDNAYVTGYAYTQLISDVKGLPAIDAAPKKNRRIVRFTPCVCGFNKHRLWNVAGTDGGRFYECARCGLKSRDYLGKTKIEAKEGWNKMIEKMKGCESHV